MVKIKVNPLPPDEDGKPGEEVEAVPEEYTPRPGCYVFPLNPEQPPVVVSGWEHVVARVAGVIEAALCEVTEALSDGKITISEALNITRAIIIAATTTGGAQWKVNTQG